MKILHLYHDLMNLYGDYANISALTRILHLNGIEHTVDRLSLNDEPDLCGYDFIYVGSGSEENQKLALSHLITYKDDLAEYINSGKFALFTGNSFEMLGESIESFLGEFEGLGIFDFKTVEQNKTRTTADAVFENCEIDKPLVGFINKCSVIEGVAEPLFSVKIGLGNTKDDCFEGVRKNNFFGTHLTGPVLIKNPHFLLKLASDLAGTSLDDDFHFEKAGYEVTLKELSKTFKLA